MENFEDKMANKVGIDKSTAKKVVEFLKEHADEALGMLKGGGEGGIKEKLGGIAKKLGSDK